MAREIVIRYNHDNILQGYPGYEVDFYENGTLVGAYRLSEKDVLSRYDFDFLKGNLERI